jgi:hypothetical protein
MLIHEMALTLFLPHMFTHIHDVSTLDSRELKNRGVVAFNGMIFFPSFVKKLLVQKYVLIK